MIAGAARRRRFPPPWTIEEMNDACFIVRDKNGQALGYFYFEDEPGRRAHQGRGTRWRRTSPSCRSCCAERTEAAGNRAYRKMWALMARSSRQRARSDLIGG
jgi:hypothetical protein